MTFMVTMTMPPLPLRYAGREAVSAFLTTNPAGGDRDRFRWVRWPGDRPKRTQQISRMCLPARAAYASING